MKYQTTMKLGLGLICGLSFFSLHSSAIASDAYSSLYEDKQELAHAIPDLRDERDVKTKKRKFFNALRPMVAAENQRIREQRQFLLNIRNKTSLTQKEQAKLETLLKYYRLAYNKDGSVPWKELLKRVDTVPLELVLSQAANESAWGTLALHAKRTTCLVNGVSPKAVVWYPVVAMQEAPMKLQPLNHHSYLSAVT